MDGNRMTHCSCSAHLQQCGTELEKLAVQTVAHRRKFQLTANQFAEFADHYATVATDETLPPNETQAYLGIIRIYRELCDIFREYLLQNWAHTVMLTGTGSLAADICALVTRLNEFAQLLDSKGAEHLDPSSPKWLQFHILDLQTISGSFEHYLDAQAPGTTTGPAVLKRLQSMRKFIAQFATADPVPGHRYFSPIPVNYQNWRLQHSDLELELEQGKGVSAIVYFGHDKRTGAEVAIKQFKWQKLKGARLKSFEREIVILATMQHPCLLKFVGAVDSPPFCIVTEWMGGGTLYHELHRHHRLDPTQLTICAIDIARGIHFLHARSIIHRDLKALNVLLTTDGYARICDFGYSRELSRQDEKMTNNIGTPHWMAPEMLSGTGIYDEKIDVYAYGMVLWEILTKKLPYAGMEAAQIITQVMMNDIRPPIPTATPRPIRELIQLCWMRDPEKRPSLHQLLALWVSSGAAFPGADPIRVDAHLKENVQCSPGGEDTSLIPTLIGISRQMSKDEISPELADRCWKSLKALDRSLDPELYVTCLSLFFKTQHNVEAAAILRCEPPGSIPLDTAVAISSFLPTEKESLNLDLVVIACKNGAAAEAAMHSLQPNHVKLALEVVARVGVRNDETRQGIVQRCIPSLQRNDPLLVVAALRCLVAINEANVVPLETIRASIQSRNTTVKLAGYVTAAKMCDEGIAMPSDILDLCLDKMWSTLLAVTVVVNSADNVENARHLVTRMANGIWRATTKIKLRILLKASQHTELASAITAIVDRLSPPLADPKEQEAVQRIRERL
jgi:serine/threonine protein kinase